MKKKIFGLAAALLLTVGLIACDDNSDSKDSVDKADDMTLKVGASPTPHVEILEYVKPLLKGGGVDLEIVKFNDYVLPNQSLEEGDINTSYFQHVPYLNKEIKEEGYDFVNASTAHIGPMGLYSRKVRDVSELEDGVMIITSNPESDWERITTILQDARLVKVRDGVDLETAIFDDIAENPKNLKSNCAIDPLLLVSTYQDDGGDLVAINANFTYGTGLNPLEDAVLLEEDNSPYVNIIVTRRGDEDSDKTRKLIEVLYCKEIQEWIMSK